MDRLNMAMIGMAVMGRNFAQNFAEKGYGMAMYNRTDQKTEDRFSEIPDNAEYKKRLHPVTGDIKGLVDCVGTEGIYFIMVKADSPDAGQNDPAKAPTQAMINQLRPHLKKGAIIVDCANSYWPDTVRRCNEFKDSGIHFFGTGVSGGEEGARYGPAIMPGGTSRDVYESRLKEPLERVAAKAQDGAPCVTYIGDNGAGHFVKMIHNGIEYGDMQLIAEAYDIMKGTGMSADEMGDVFAKWNQGPLKSYLIEITAEVLHQKDSSGNGNLVDYIVDAAKMKGTGTWTVLSSLELGSGVEPIHTIYSAVASRAMSSKKDARVEMSEILPLPRKEFSGDKKGLIQNLETALYVAKISSYTQGIALMQSAAKENNFGGLDIAEIARIWRAGCIIRAEFLGDITDSYRKKPELPNLMAAPVFNEAVNKGMESLEKVCSTAIDMRVPAMAFDASKDFILQSVNAVLPANITQGQRDFFGAHTYKRTDKEGTFHTEWMLKDRPEVKE